MTKNLAFNDKQEILFLKITKVFVVNQATIGSSLFSWKIANAIRLKLIYKEKISSRPVENLKFWVKILSILRECVWRMQPQVFIWDFCIA